MLQLVDKLAKSLLRTHLVDKLWDFYVCTRKKWEIFERFEQEIDYHATYPHYKVKELFIFFNYTNFESWNDTPISAFSRQFPHFGCTYIKYWVLAVNADQATSGVHLKFTKIKFGKFKILQHVSSILMVECLTEMVDLITHSSNHHW